MRPHFIEAFPVDAVKEDKLPEVVHTIDGATISIQGLLARCPVVVDARRDIAPTLPFETGDILTPEEEGIELERLTHIHQRSYEMTGIESLNGQAIVDEFGNIYHSVNLKGNNFSSPAVIGMSTDETRPIAFGLQESNTMGRILKASETMRKHGIGTEYIIGLSEPQYFPWSPIGSHPDDVEYVPLAEYKRRLVEQTWMATREEEQTTEAFVELSQKFEGMTFYVSTRAMDTSYRLFDIYFDGPDGPIFEEIIEMVNKQDLMIGEPLKPGDPKELIRYLEDYMAPQLAYNLVKLHIEAELAHYSISDMNVSALGSLVDADSIGGEPLGLGDEAITAKDKAIDMLDMLASLHENHCHYTNPLLRKRSEVREIFVNTYLSMSMELLKEKGLSEPEIVEQLGEIIMEAKEYLDEGIWEATTKQVHDDLQQLQKIVLGEYGRLFFRQETKEIEPIFQYWRQHPPRYDYEIAQLVEDNLERYAGLLYQDLADDIFNEGFESVTEKLNTVMFFLFSTYNVMAEDLANMELDDFVDSILVEDRPEFDRIYNLDPKLAKTILTSLVKEYERLKVAEVGFYRAINGYLPMLVEELKKLTEMQESTSILPGNERIPRLPAAPNRMVMQTEGVDISTIVEYIEAHLDIEILDCDLNFDSSIVGGSYHRDYESSFLSEIISDVELDDIHDMQYKDSALTGFRYRTPNGYYIAFVEEKEDGTKRLLLHLDRELDGIDDLSTNKQIAEAIRREYALNQLELFSQADYFVSLDLGSNRISAELLDYLTPSY